VSTVTPLDVGLAEPGKRRSPAPIHPDRRVHQVGDGARSAGFRYKDAGGNSETIWSQTDVPAGTWAARWPRLSMPMTNRLPGRLGDPAGGHAGVAVNRFQAEVRPLTWVLANACDPSASLQADRQRPAEAAVWPWRRGHPVGPGRARRALPK